MDMASVCNNCILCKEPVRERQQGIQCDGCLKWNHRTCNTGISQEAYRAAVREGANIVWYCASCHGNPVAESTRDGETSADILESEEFNPPLDSSADNFQDQAQEAPAYNLQEIAETTVRALQGYDDDKKNPKELLEACSHLVKPINN